MKFSRFILANLFRKKVRLILTIGSFAIALLLFTFLAVVKSAFSRGATLSRNTSSPIDDAGPLQLSTSQRPSRGSRNGTATAFTSSCQARNE